MEKRRFLCVICTAVGVIFLIQLVAFFYIHPNFPLFGLSHYKEKLKECVPMLDDANALIREEFNGSRRMLKHPEDYEVLAGKCQRAVECVQASGVSIELSGHSEHIGPCQFFIYYHGPFSRCAQQLIAKRGMNISCIETLFADFTEENANLCEKWNQSEQCLLQQIMSTCDDLPAQVSRVRDRERLFSGEVSKLRPALCPDT